MLQCPATLILTVWILGIPSVFINRDMMAAVVPHHDSRCEMHLPYIRQQEPIVVQLRPINIPERRLRIQVFFSASPDVFCCASFQYVIDTRDIKLINFAAVLDAYEITGRCPE